MFTLNCRGRLWVVDKPVVMGIINVNTDSFYSGSRQSGTAAVLEKAEQMVSDKAWAIDLGAQSTRPGSERISAAEEISRLLEPVKAMRHAFPDLLISIDTYYSEVARVMADEGADIINDISAGLADPGMLEAVAGTGLPYILMHGAADPDQLHADTAYTDLSRDVLDFLAARVAEAESAGIKDIIVDPGFGFGKNARENFRLLREMEILTVLQKPVLAGLSRKSTIWKTLGITPEEALNGSTVLNTLALANGAQILRVHDVKEAAETITLMQAYNQA